jgi:hypothetical protein
MALAHVVKNKVEAAYRRGDLFYKRQLLMSSWAEYCSISINQNGKLIELNQRPGVGLSS